MPDDDPTGPPPWHKDNLGRAKAAFDAARDGPTPPDKAPPEKARSDEGSAMVRAKAHSPQLTPHGPVRQAADQIVHKENAARDDAKATKKSDKIASLKSENVRNETQKSLELTHEFNKGENR